MTVLRSGPLSAFRVSNQHSYCWKERLCGFFYACLLPVWKHSGMCDFHQLKSDTNRYFNCLTLETHSLRNLFLKCRLISAFVIICSVHYLQQNLQPLLGVQHLVGINSAKTTDSVMLRTLCNNLVITTTHLYMRRRVSK